MNVWRPSGTPLVVWAVLFAAICGCGDEGGTRAADPTVGGIAFAPPAPVLVDDVDDVEPQIAADADGAWIAVWERETPIDGAALLHDVVAARSADGGVRWDAPVGLSGGFVGFTPRLAGDGHGDLVVVGEDRPGGDLAAARTLDGGVTWETRFPVSAPGTRSNLDEVPGDYEIATDRAGTWIVVFTLDGALGNSLVVAAASHDVGRTWEAPIALHPGASNDFQPTIAADGHGGWVIVWTSTDPLANLGGRSDGVGLLAVHSGDDGRTWSSPSAVVARRVGRDPRRRRRRLAQRGPRHTLERSRRHVDHAARAQQFRVLDGEPAPAHRRRHGRQSRCAVVDDVRREPRADRARAVDRPGRDVDGPRAVSRRRGGLPA